jgi:proline iminopeptidase
MANLYITSLGQGSPVVFLHGGPGEDFNYIIDALRPHLSKHRFILFDQRGSVLSPVAADQVKNLNFKQLVGDLEALRQTLGYAKLTLFAHSYGTVLAMAYYKAYPEHVERLVLTGSFPPSEPEGMDAFGNAVDTRQQALIARPADIAHAIALAPLPADPRKDTVEQARIRRRISVLAPSNVIDLTRWHQLTGAGVYYNQAASTVLAGTVPQDLDISATIAAHPVPITVIQGDRDYVDPGASRWAALAAKGKATIAVMPASAHAAWIDQPEAFSHALAKGLGDPSVP